jgi:hypothetical protein
MDSLKQEIKAWEENRNEKSNSVDWRFTTADARINTISLNENYTSNLNPPLSSPF